MSDIGIYLVYFDHPGGWFDETYSPRSDSEISLYSGAPGLTSWTRPVVEWTLPMVPIPDVTAYSGSIAIEESGDPGMRTILRRTGALMDLGGDGVGWQVFRPFERLELVDNDRCILREDLREQYAEFARQRGREPSPLPVAKYRFFEDRLVPNTVARADHLAELIAIEDEGPGTDVTDPAKCGFRAWVKHHGVTGVVFKKIWDSTDTIEYDHAWFYETLGDEPYDWD